MLRLRIDIPPGYAIIYGKKQLKAVMRLAGAEIARKARALIRNGGRKRVSTPGQPPVSRTGNLARSIKVRPWQSGEGATIKDVAFYALFLEKGAKGGGGRGKKGKSKARGAGVTQRVLEARPFMEPALDQVVSNGLADRIRDAVVGGMVFRRGP